MYLAFLTVGISLIFLSVELVLRAIHPELAPRGFMTLIVVVLFMGGIQLLCLGIIGSYLAHIYDEVKRRPAYLVKSYINYPSTDESLGSNGSGTSSNQTTT